MAWLWRAAVVAAVVALGGPVVASAQEAVFLVRHAERLDQSSDAVLSPAGEARAVRLATLLRDSGITHIYTTDLKRTIQTAAPLATRLGLTPVQLPSGDIDGLVTRVRAAAPRDRLLIVGHSNTLPGILKQLGVPSPAAIGDNEYDNLFLVLPGGPPGSAVPSLVRLHFE